MKRDTRKVMTITLDQAVNVMGGERDIERLKRGEIVDVSGSLRRLDTRDLEPGQLELTMR